MLVTHICSDYPVIIDSVSGVHFYSNKFSYAVSEDPGQAPQFMASDLGMHTVLIFYLHSFQL